MKGEIDTRVLIRVLILAIEDIKRSKENTFVSSKSEEPEMLGWWFIHHHNHGNSCESYIHIVIDAYIECDGVSFLNDDKDENADLKGNLGDQRLRG